MFKQGDRVALRNNIDLVEDFCVVGGVIHLHEDIFLLLVSEEDELNIYDKDGLKYAFITESSNELLRKIL